MPRERKNGGIFLRKRGINQTIFFLRLCWGVEGESGGKWGERKERE